MADYVRATHQAYLDAIAALPPGDRARLPLVKTVNNSDSSNSALTVLVAGTRNLHVLATTDPMPAPIGPEVALPDSIDDLHWTVRFFDPVVAPGLGLLDEASAPDPQGVREVLGIRSVVYHLTVPPGSSLTTHHAQHAGTGLAHAHAAADRDYTTLAQLAPNQGGIVAEMYQAYVNQMPRAHTLLAQELTGSGAALVAIEPSDFTAVRRATLDAIRGR